MVLHLAGTTFTIVKVAKYLKDRSYLYDYYLGMNISEDSDRLGLMNGLGQTMLSGENGQNDFHGSLGMLENK